MDGAERAGQVYAPTAVHRATDCVAASRGALLAPDPHRLQPGDRQQMPMFLEVAALAGRKAHGPVECCHSRRMIVQCKECAINGGDARRVPPTVDRLVGRRMIRKKWIQRTCDSPRGRLVVRGVAVSKNPNLLDGDELPLIHSWTWGS